MKQTFGYKQISLEYAYVHTSERLKRHPELAEKYKKIIEEYPHYTNIEDAKRAAFYMSKRTNSIGMIFGKADKDKDHYYIPNDFIVVDSIGRAAADFLGLLPIEEYWRGNLV